MAMILLAAIAAAFIALMLAVGTVLNGWALTYLWDWFVVPIFHLPHLSIAYAAGLGLVISYLTHQGDYAKEEDNAAMQRVVNTLLQPPFAVGIGWVIHQFV